jgi:hypothetical protein
VRDSYCAQLEHGAVVVTAPPQQLSHGESLITQGSLQTIACWGWKREFQAERQHSPMRQPVVPANKAPKTAYIINRFIMDLLIVESLRGRGR